MGVLELTALPSIKRENWVPVVQQTDALLIGGGDCPYLSYWMRESGLADLLPSLWAKTVYVGLKAGSMVVTPTFGEDFAVHEALIGADKGLGLVDFSLLPHLDHERFPENSLTNLERVAASIPAPTYAIDDQTAIKVTDSTERLSGFARDPWRGPDTRNHAWHHFGLRRLWRTALMG